MFVNVKHVGVVILKIKTIVNVRHVVMVMNQIAKVGVLKNQYVFHLNNGLMAYANVVKLLTVKHKVKQLANVLVVIVDMI